VNVHGVRVFLACLILDEPRANTLDLNACAGLLLNVLDEHTLQAC
jgi:hypothetical protein